LLLLLLFSLLLISSAEAWGELAGGNKSKRKVKTKTKHRRWLRASG